MPFYKHPSLEPEPFIPLCWAWAWHPSATTVPCDNEPNQAQRHTAKHVATGELSDQSNREANVSKLLTAMSKLRMDFGLTVDDMLEISDRDGVLLALHLFQVRNIDGV